VGRNNIKQEEEVEHPPAWRGRLQNAQKEGRQQSFIVCVVFCAVFCLSVFCYFV
jgi:hypothetical protein